MLVWCGFPTNGSRKCRRSEIKGNKSGYPHVSFSTGLYGRSSLGAAPECITVNRESTHPSNRDESKAPDYASRLTGKLRSVTLGGVNENRRTLYP